MVAHLHTLKANAPNQGIFQFSVDCQFLHIKHMLHNHVQYKANATRIMLFFFFFINVKFKKRVKKRENKDM